MLRQSRKKNFWNINGSSRGASLVEFGLLLALIAAVCTVAVFEVGKNTTVTLCRTSLATRNKNTFITSQNLEYRASCASGCSYVGTPHWCVPTD